MINLFIVWGITLLVLCGCGYLKKRVKINNILVDSIWVIGCIILSPLFLVVAFIKTTWKIVLYGIHGVIND